MIQIIQLNFFSWRTFPFLNLFTVKKKYFLVKAFNLLEEHRFKEYRQEGGD